MLNLSVNLYEKRKNIIFVNKKKLFLKCKIEPDLYDYNKTYFENYYDHTKAKFLLKYHSITHDYLYFEFPLNITPRFKFCNEYDFCTQISKLTNLIFNKQHKELDINHPFILQVKQLYDNKQLIKNNLILKYLEKYINSPENKMFYINVITTLSVNNLIYNEHTKQYFFIDYNDFGITLNNKQRFRFNSKVSFI